MGAPQRQGGPEREGSPQTQGGPGGPAGQGGYEWLTLDPDEQVLWEGQPHAYSIIPAIVIGIPLSLVLIGLLIIVGAVLQRRNTTFLLTSTGLYKKTGIISRDVQKIEFGKVQNISFSQGPLGNLVGYGNVDISTAGGSGVEMQFRAVPDPKSVQEQINRQIRQSRPEGSSEESGGRSGDAVVDEILTELRAIRRAVEGENTTATETHQSTTRDASQQGGTGGQRSGHQDREQNTGQRGGQGGNEGRSRTQEGSQRGDRDQGGGNWADGSGDSESDRTRDWDDE